MIGENGNPDAPHLLLDCVGVVYTSDGYMGTGTVLLWGGHQYVLTAAHVVEDHLNHAGGGDAAQPLAPGQLSFVPDVDGPNPRSGDIPGVHNYAVTRVIGRSSFNGLDIALLQLDRPVGNIQQAGLLPEANGITNEKVFIAGYGGGDGAPGLTNGYHLTYGIARIDAAGVDGKGALSDNGNAVVGKELDYVREQGMASTTKGDSGGPDFSRCTAHKTATAIGLGFR